MLLDSAKENESLAKSDLTFSRNGSEVTSLFCGREEWIAHSLKAGISKKIGSQGSFSSGSTMAMIWKKQSY